MRALAILMLLAGVAAADVGSVSPGKLARAHARFEQQCDRCHIAGGVPASQCLACHTKLADKIVKGLGFHATVTSKPCIECHSDHKGRDFELSPPPSPSFDHRVAVFPLDGKHGQLACAKCHAKSQWVGIPTTCARCHKDTAHRGQLGSECAKCHRAEGWKPPTRTAADHKISLGGGHAKLACEGCHRGGRHLVPEQVCSHCHNQPHGGTTAACETCHAVAGWKEVTYTHRTAAAHIEGAHEKLACLSCHPQFKFGKTPTSCTGCHDKQRPHPPLGACEQCHAADTWVTTKFDHQAADVGFALDGAHLPLACTKCHTEPIQWGQPRRICTSCHANVHGTQFGAKACTECHTTSVFKPSTITTAQHEPFFPLRDSHVKTKCADCHKSGVFVGTAKQCAMCHEDTRHKGRFGTTCEKCHDATVWSHTPSFDHATTGFALERGHANLKCAQCHGANGLALVNRAAPKDCNTCHATPHDRYFSKQCTQCHSTEKWTAVAKFDHGKTAFPLELRHATLRCTSCHDAKRQPAIQRVCRSCHGDPHRGSNAWDCEDCHRPDRWRIIRFDHDLTDYPLTGRHRIVSCGLCHTNPNWTGVRTDCVSCHAFDAPKDTTHQGEFTCEDCHTTFRWQTIRRH